MRCHIRREQRGLLVKPRSDRRNSLCCHSLQAAVIDSTIRSARTTEMGRGGREKLTPPWTLKLHIVADLSFGACRSFLGSIRPNNHTARQGYSTATVTWRQTEECTTSATCPRSLASFATALFPLRRGNPKSLLLRQEGHRHPPSARVARRQDGVNGYAFPYLS